MGTANRLRSGDGRYTSFMHKVGLRENANCICSAIQTPQHYLNCRIIGIRRDLRTIDEDFLNWIGNNKLLELYFLFNHTNICIYILYREKNVVITSTPGTT